MARKAGKAKKERAKTSPKESVDKPAAKRAMGDGLLGTSADEAGPTGQAARIEALQEQLYGARRAGDKGAEINALLAIGYEALEMDPGLAMMHFRLAERVSKGEGARLHEAIGGQGRVLRRGKRFDEAIERFRQAEAIADKVGNRVAQVRWMVRRSAAHRAKGEGDTASTLLREAEVLLRPPVSEGSWAQILGPVNLFDHDSVATLVELEGELGRDLAARHDEEGAEDQYRSAWSHAESQEDWDEVNTWAGNAGNSCARQGRSTDALACYEVALAAARRLGSDDRTIASARAMANVYYSAIRHEEGGERLERLAGELTGRARLLVLDEALALYDQALSAVPGLRVARQMAETESGEALSKESRRKVAEVRQRLERMQGMKPNADGPSPLDLWLPRLLERTMEQRDVPRALEAAHLVCDVRLGLALRGGREWARLIGGDLLQQAGLDFLVVSDTLHLLVEEDRTDEASALLQRFKAPAFCVQTLQRLWHSPPEGQDLRALVDATRELSEAVDALAGVAQPDFLRVVNRVRRAGERMREAGESIRAADPILHARLGLVVRSSDLIDALPLDGGVAIVDFLVGREATNGVVYVRAADGVQASLLQFMTFTVGQAQELMELHHRGNLSNSLGGEQMRSLLEIAKVLHDRLFCILARTLSERGITQLVLIPDLLTRGLPLHLALTCGKEIKIPGIDTSDAEFLCEVMPVEYAPALQAVAASQAYPRPRSLTSIAGFANPLGDLIGVNAAMEDFGNRIAGDVHWTLKSGAEMTRAAVNEAVRTADMVVFGTHGHFVPGDLRASHLVMHDQPWSVDDMLRMPPLERRALLVLLACEAGAVAVSPDETLSWGIPGALVNAGASAVLANLWPVVDVIADILLARFLKHLAHRGYRPSVALFRAVRDLRRMSRDEAAAACRAHYDLLRSHHAEPRTIVGARTLLEWVEDSDSPTPFASPYFWGATVIVGSGWHTPAGASVGNPNRISDTVLQLASAGDLLRNGKAREALEVATRLSLRSDGGNRGRAYALMADAMMRTADLTISPRVSRRVRRLLAAAERIARAEDDEELESWIGGLRHLLEDDHVGTIDH